jgi:hypothetical protein
LARKWAAAPKPWATFMTSNRPLEEWDKLLCDVPAGANRGNQWRRQLTSH